MTISSTLYRKYRPDSFDSVIGQDSVVSALRSAVENNSPAHAYLFSGSRGTGKTSLARIFAKSLGTSDADIQEIDAASHTGVDNIRELRDGVSTIPFSSNYKVYIIDEAHMLSKAAFNALLKTLEEPPAHVIFILATTEKHKILPTILSRCQVFDFSLATKADLVQLIQRTVVAEGKTIDEESADLIAAQGNGSYRDTLSALQRVLSSVTADSITVDHVRTVFATTDTDQSIDLLLRITGKDSTAAYELFTKLLESGAQTKDILADLIELCRTILVIRYSQADHDRIKAEQGTERFERLASADTVTSKIFLSLLNAYDTVLTSKLPQQHFEAYVFSLDKEN